MIIWNPRNANRNNDVNACNTLDAFFHQVNAKETNGQLTSQQAAGLRQQATASSLPPPTSLSLQSQQHLQPSPETSLITNTESSGQPSTLSLSP